jgi:hypothetical protein
MRYETLVPLVAGALGTAALVVGVFFLRFWRRTKDSLFFAFAIAFWLMAVNQVAPVLLGVERENLGGIYLFRLAAFVLIIVAIVRKNLSRTP